VEVLVKTTLFVAASIVKVKFATSGLRERALTGKYVIAKANPASRAYSFLIIF
jgi:hypothetical protein